MSNEFKVLYVHQERTQLQKPALCMKGRKYMLCVMADYPVHLVKRPVELFAKCRTVPYKDGLYPATQAVDQFTQIGARNGITKAAQTVLLRAKANGVDTTHIDEDAIDDEEHLTMKSETETGTPATDETTTDSTNTNQETKVTAKKTKPATKKSAAKKAAPAKKASTPAKKGAGGFREGTAKEKCFVAFKAGLKEYEALEHGEKKQWVEKLANKQGVQPTTVSSWIGGDFRKALAKK